MRPTLFLLLFFTLFLHAETTSVKKVFYINSYHTGLYWSDWIEKTIKKVLEESQIPIQFERVEMDSKRNNSELYKEKIAQKIINQIKNFKPDIIITSDDNALKYVIMPYLKNSSIPVVFCGVSGSFSEYGLPAKNITGMEEVQLVPQMIELLTPYAKGKRIGFLKDDSMTTRIELEVFKRQLNTDIDARFVSTIKQWKKQFLDLQKNVDILLVEYGGAIKNWAENKKEIEAFMRENTLIPTATGEDNLIHSILVTFSHIPEEQGEWAAHTALRVLKGEDIQNIPFVQNKKGDIHINVTLAKKLNIIFPFDIIDNATLVK